MASNLKVGGVLQRSFDVWTSNILGFVGLTLVVNAPFLVLQVLPFLTDVSIFWNTGGSLGMTVTAFFITGLVTYAVFDALRTGSSSIWASLKKTVSRLVPMFFAWVLLLLIFVVATGLSFAPFGGLAWALVDNVELSTAGGIGGIALLLVGFTVAMIVVTVLSLALAVVIPAVVVEDVGPIGALKRSWELTKGQRILIFAIFIIYGLIYTVIMGFVGCFAGVAGGFGTAMSTSPGADEFGGLTVIIPTLVSGVVSAVAMTYQATLNAVVYHDLREIKEGLSVDDLVDVFE